MNTRFADVMTLINVLGLVGLAVGLLAVIAGAALEQRHMRRRAARDAALRAARDADHHEAEEPTQR